MLNIHLVRVPLPHHCFLIIGATAETQLLGRHDIRSRRYRRGTPVEMMRIKLLDYNDRTHTGYRTCFDVGDLTEVSTISVGITNVPKGCAEELRVGWRTPTARSLLLSRLQVGLCLSLAITQSVPRGYSPCASCLGTIMRLRRGNVDDRIPHRQRN